MGSINLSPLGMVEAKADTNASITIGGVTINLNSHDAPKYALVTGDTVTIVEAPGDAYNIKIEYVGGWPDSYYKATLKDMNYTGATTSVDDKEVAMYISIPWVEGIVDIVESNSICGSVENESIGMYIDVQDKCTFTGSGTLTVGDNTGNYATGLYVAQVSMTI
ncbi:MAG: hypothetical protein Q4G60_14270 [bacterium]|nr:hypothetical protein [bacterium]